MSTYMTEDEQIEAIKQWWQRHSTAIILGISLIMLSVAGYRYWTWHQEKMAIQASNTYEQMMAAFSRHKNKHVQAHANQLIKNHEKTVYADVSHLMLAKLFVEKGKLNLAQKELQQVLANENSAALKQVAKLRYARILNAMKSYDEALKALETVTAPAYLPLINELKGDIYASMGNYQQAVESYRLALDKNQNNGSGNLFLEMKTNEVASMVQNMTIRNDVQAA